MAKKIKHTPEYYTVPSTPSTPATGSSKLYPKTDNEWYYLTDAGIENPLKTTVYTGKTIWVDSVYGNDGTAVVYRFDKPYSSIIAAVTAAVSGDTVVVRAGTYSNFSNILKNGVNIHFQEGTIVYCYSTTPFNDNGGSVTARITGYAKFYASLYGNSFIRTQLNVGSSNLYFEFDEYVGVSNVVFQVENGTVSVKARRIVEQFQYLSYIGGTGNLAYLEADEVVGQSGTLGVCFIYLGFCSDGIAKTSRLNIKKYTSTATYFWSPLFILNCNELARIEFTGDLFSTAASGSSNGSCICIQGPGTVVVNGRLNSIGNRIALINNGAGTKATLVLKDTVAVNTASSFNIGIQVYGAGSYLKVDNSYISSTCTHTVYQHGNSFMEIHNSRIHNRINTSSNARCITIDDASNTTILNNVIMYNESTDPASYSIDSTAVQNIKIYSTVSSNKQLSSNINPLIGSYIYDTTILPINNVNE